MLELNQLKERVEKVRDMLKIQCTDGNWDFSAYMRGLANGLIMAVAVLDGTEPEFKEAIPGELRLGIKSCFKDFCSWIEQHRGAQVYILNEEDELVVAVPCFDQMYNDFELSWLKDLEASTALMTIQRNQTIAKRSDFMKARFRTDWRIRLVSALGFAVMRLGLRINSVEMRMRKSKVIEVEDV